MPTGVSAASSKPSTSGTGRSAPKPEASEIPKIKEKIANGLPQDTDNSKAADKKQPDPAPVEPKPTDKKS